MATAEATHLTHGDRTTMELVAGGSTGEAIGGIGAVVLAILGLAGVLPFVLAAVATICVGAALILEGGALTARYSRILREVGARSQTEVGEVGGGMTTELLGGVAGVVLGVLAILGVASLSLMAIAAIVFGVSLLLGSGTTTHLNALPSDYEMASAARVAGEAVRASAGTQVLVGLASATLGVLALIGLSPLTLVLVAMLGVGGATLMTGSALTGRMREAMP